MADGSASPFSYVHRLLNYGTAASRSSKGGDNLRFSNDKEYCSYEGYGFGIAAWKGMVKDIIRSAETLLIRRLMFCNSDTVEPINPYTFIDSETDYVNNHYFAASDPEYRNTARTKLLTSLRKSEHWERMLEVENGELKFVKAEVDVYTKDDIAFRELILLAINWTGELTGRGTEILSLLFKNKMAAARNVIIQDGQVILMIEYHKSQAVMDDIKVYICVTI